MQRWPRCRRSRPAGGTAHYHQVDLRDGDAMATEMARISELSGTIDVLVHAAGLEISRSMPDKSPDEYDLVFDVKADGWFNLIKGLGRVPLESAVVFSSIAGRFGNAGQTDYSAANDLLCKQASALDPDTLGVAIDWTAWGDIGMATRGSIPQIMEAAGIDMLPAAAGIPVVRRELDGRRPQPRDRRSPDDSVSWPTRCTRPAVSPSTPIQRSAARVAETRRRSPQPRSGA